MSEATLEGVSVISPENERGHIADQALAQRRMEVDKRRETFKKGVSEAVIASIITIAGVATSFFFPWFGIPIATIGAMDAAKGITTAVKARPNK